MVGERVFRSVLARTTCRTSTPRIATRSPHIGKTDQGEDVEISKRAAESDLIVYVNINLVAMDGGHKSVAVGLAELQEPQAPPQRGDDAALALATWTRARVTARSTTPTDADGPAARATSGVKIFQIETTVNNETFPKNLGFLNKREWEWSHVRPGADDGREEGERAGAAARAPRVLPSDRGPVQADRRSTPARSRPCTSGRSRTCTGSSSSRSQGQSDVAGVRPAVHLPVQRELDPEPDPRALPGPRVPVQHVPEQAAREARAAW